MKKKKVSLLRDIRIYIVSVAIILISVPTLAAFYSVQGILDSAVAIGLNPQVDQELEVASKRLKDLARVAPDRESQLRADFERLQVVRRQYGLLIETKPALHHSLMEVFLIVFGISLLFAIGMAWFLNKRIVRSYDLALEKMSAAEHRALYLEARESWSVVAQKMVHEVKNPLTPIQVMVGRLKKKYMELKNLGEFNQGFYQSLDETDQIVQEEVGNVNLWVDAFASYARTPAPEVVKVEMREFIDETIKQFSDYWDAQTFSWSTRPESEVWTQVDPKLLWQVLFNLAKNSVESISADKKVTIEFSIADHSSSSVSLRVCDNGPGIVSDKADRIFKPFFTTKTDAKGSGLGLAICKRIMVEIGGDIGFIPRKDGPGACFNLNLPLALGRKSP